MKRSFGTFFNSQNPSISDEKFMPPNIRSKSPLQKQQQSNSGDRANEQLGTEHDVIITGVSTYAEAAKVSKGNSQNYPRTTFIGKRLNFNRRNPNKQQSNFQKQSTSTQQTTNSGPPQLP